MIVDAAQRLVDKEGESFTIQQVVKEAGVALQTFYRYFSSKDELLLAMFEERIAQACEEWRQQAAALTDPLARLHHYVTGVISRLDDVDGAISRRSMSSEHYRLLPLFPEELTEADRTFTELLIPEIEAAAEEGRLAPGDVENDAWLITQLVMATFHHYSFATTSESFAEIGENLWLFCLRALGGQPAGSP